MRKSCRIVVAAVLLLGLSAGPAAAASNSAPHRPTGWYCQFLPTFC